MSRPVADAPKPLWRRRAVFLDRDGTIIDDTGFIRRLEDVKLRPKVAEAIGRLNAAGWLVIVVTNQSGVARGLLTEKDVAVTNQRMQELLQLEGAHVDAIYHCPHLPEGKVPEYAVVCDCRKPRPGMLLKAAREHDIDMTASVTIGDAPRDVGAGLDAGTRAILLTDSPTRADQAPDACGSAPDLLSAVAEVLEHPATAGKTSGGRHAPAPTKRSRKREAVTKQQAPMTPEVDSARAALAATAGKEDVVSDTIPVHRAPKEFVPEQEPVESGEAPPDTSVAAEPTPPAEETVDAAGAARCARCAAVIPSSDVETGKAYDKDGVRLCRDCVSALQAQRTRTTPVTNEDLLRELRNITRALTYERFSYWHVFGAIVQAGAIGCVVISHFMDFATEGLLLAIFLQLVSLTFFLLGRQ